MYTLDDYREALASVAGYTRTALLEEARKDLRLSCMEMIQLDRQTRPDWA